MTRSLRAQISIPGVSGTPSDVSVNTLYFRTADLFLTDVADITAKLVTFYNQVKVVYPASSNFAAAGIKWYDMAAAKPRPPLLEGLLGTTGTGSGAGGPAEVAMVITFHSNKVAGENFARRRGRIYLGPIASAKMGNPTIGSTDIATLVSAASTLLNASNAASWKWIVWSQTQHDSPQGLNFPDSTVQGGWVDNAWDTQRRRGQDSTSRTTYGVGPVGLIEGFVPPAA